MESFLTLVGVKKGGEEKKKPVPGETLAGQEKNPSMLRQIFLLDGMVEAPQNKLSQQTMAAIPIVQI